MSVSCAAKSSPKLVAAERSIPKSVNSLMFVASDGRSGKRGSKVINSVTPGAASMQEHSNDGFDLTKIVP